MFDEMDRLGEKERLFLLLDHYARLGAEAREVWQDRLMRHDGIASEEMAPLHGELIAYDWVEQNTGATPAPRRGVAGQCYRVTTAGLKALKLARVPGRQAA